MEDDQIETVLQQSLLALLDVKPSEPLHFLATYFQRDCEKSNRVAQASYLLENMTVQHPAMQERLLKAYTTISQYKVQQEVYGLTGDIYTDLLAQLASWLPNYPRDRLLHKLQCQSTEYISFPVFKTGVLTCTLLKEYVKEVNGLFKSLSNNTGKKTPRQLCDAALGHLRTALKSTATDSTSVLEVGINLGIMQLVCSLNADEAIEIGSRNDFTKEEDFLNEAIDIFLSQIPHQR